MVDSLMVEPLRVTFARWCASTRAELDITQAELAHAVGVSRSLIAAFEAGHRVPDLDMVDRVATALGVRVALDRAQPRIIGAAHERDALHARCSGHVGRRLTGAGLLVAREVEIVDGRARGWIDLLAFDPRTRRLLIIEIKTGIEDVGAIERQVAWYERLAMEAGRRKGWEASGHSSWLLVLATDAADRSIDRHHELLRAAFPLRASGMRAMLADGLADGRGLALVDPARRRGSWLMAASADGRRTALPYTDRGEALRRLGLSPFVTMSRMVAVPR